MTLTDIATAEVATIEPDVGVRDALSMMDDRNIGSVVVTENGAPTGIVTDRMIAMSLRDANAIDDVSVRDVMTADLITIEEDATHFHALETLSEHGIRRLPVTDSDGSLTGIITLDDLVMMTAAELSHASDVIEQQATPM